jgi:hypothetical protein
VLGVCSNFIEIFWAGRLNYSLKKTMFGLAREKGGVIVFFLWLGFG